MGIFHFSAHLCVTNLTSLHGLLLWTHCPNLSLLIHCWCIYHNLVSFWAALAASCGLAWVPGGGRAGVTPGTTWMRCIDAEVTSFRSYTSFTFPFTLVTNMYWCRLHLSVHTSTIYNNPLHCDCKLRWLPSILSTVFQGQHATCATPASLSGYQIQYLAEDQFVACGEFPEWHHVM